jgi:hypothetical protein
MVASLFNAAMGKISASYINLPFAGSSQLKFRERVYCYELYHQLCVAQELQEFKEMLGGLQIAGEPDKTGNPEAEKNNLALTKPDLIIHLPGEMGRNFIVGEVKPAVASWKSIVADLCKLAKFTAKEKMNYRCGVFILFGEGKVREKTVLRRLQKAIGHVTGNLKLDLSRLECFWHKNASPLVHRYSFQNNVLSDETTNS